MMKIEIKVEEVTRILEIIRPFAAPERYMSIDFGTGKVSGANGVADAMTSKVSVATGTEQVEVAFRTKVPEEIDRPLEECGLLNPLERAVFEVASFVSVADALSQYEQAMNFIVDDAKVTLEVGEFARMPVYKVDSSMMKALIPHRQNSNEFPCFDKDIMTIRFVGKELLESAKTAMSLMKKVESEDFRYYVVSCLDIPMITQEVEKDGKKVAVPRYNAKVQMVGTDRYAFASSIVNAFVHKGAGNDLLNMIADKDSLENIKSPIISFAKVKEEEKEVIKPSIESYADFKKAYDAARDVHVDAREFRFGIPMDAMDKIIRLVSVEPNAYVDVVVGEKYLCVMLNGLGCIYMCAQKKLFGDGFLSKMRDIVEGVANKKCSIALDTKKMQSTLKVTQLYEKDALYSKMPLELQIEERGITVRRGEAVSLVPAVSAETKIDSVVYGVNPSYISCVMNGLPTGTIQLNYGEEKAIMVFTKGGETPSGTGTMFTVLGMQDIEASKRQIEEVYNREQEEKQKKENKGKK